MKFIQIRQPTDVVRVHEYLVVTQRYSGADAPDLWKRFGSSRWGSIPMVLAEPEGVCIELPEKEEGVLLEFSGRTATEMLDYLIHAFSSDHIAGFRFARLGQFLAVSSNRSDKLRVIGVPASRLDEEDRCNYDLFRIGPDSRTAHAVVFERRCAWYYSAGSDPILMLVGRFPDEVAGVLLEVVTRNWPTNSELRASPEGSVI